MNTELTLSAHAFSGVLVRTVLAIKTAHALPTIGAGPTVGRRPITACIISLITGLAATAYALTGPCLITIIIANTANALASIGDAERRRAVTATVVYGVTGLAEIANTLLTVAVPIGGTGHTPAAVSQTDRRIPTTARVIICLIADHTLLTHALQTVTVAVVLAAHTV